MPPRHLAARSNGPDERGESFVSDSHGRDHEMTAELALDDAGNFLVIRLSGYGNLGAYVGRGTPIPPTANAVKNMIGVYRTPLIEVATKIVVTNTLWEPIGAPGGPRAITIWNVWSTTRRPRSGWTGSNCAAATTSLLR